MVEEGTYLHADADSFYASVEQRDDPSLRGRPVIVGGGVVLAASYEAKAFGVRTPMGETQARRLCPQAIVVRPRMEAYSEASKAMFAVFRDTTPLVEGLSIDEAFLDVGGLRRIAGIPSEIGARLRETVREQVGIPITVGIARTKFLAKVASAVGKPDGLLVVPIGEELTFLHAHPVERLWGVGPVTAKKLHHRSIVTVADVAALGEPALVAITGRAAGRHLHALAHNRTPAGSRRPATALIGTQRALGRRASPPETLDIDLIALVDRLARRLRRAHRVSRTVTLRLRFRDFSRATRSTRFPRRRPIRSNCSPPAASCSATPCRPSASRHHAHRHHVQQPLGRRRGPDGAAVRRPGVDRHRFDARRIESDSARKPSRAASFSGGGRDAGAPPPRLIPCRPRTAGPPGRHAR